MLNLLYIENKNAQIAVKTRKHLSRRISVKNVEIQGSVWAGLKCTAMMDTLNKTVMAEKSLQYYYKEDKNIPIGVRGMVDDTLGVSKCGTEAIQLNSVLNSFVQTQRLTLSKTKSVVVHIGKKHKNTLPCPKLKIHNSDMKEAGSAKYLGNFVTSSGGVRDTIEDRRNKGWGKVATIKGILSAVDLGDHRVEVGLLLRKAILVNSLLFTAETWSGVKKADLARIEQVDQSLLESLVSCHSKTPKEFAHLELETLKLRHILTQNRLLYHHHIITQNENETIRKIYEKQKTTPTKGDWFELLKEDFKFIEQEMDDEKIKSITKEQYKKQVKQWVRKAAFKFFIKEKEGHKKVQNIVYEDFAIQPYLKSKLFNAEERNLLFALRSNCHPAKNNFRKMNQNNLLCSWGCQKIENQAHVFKECPILSSCQQYPPMEYIFGTLTEQKEALRVFLPIEKKRKQLKENILPGEAARTRALAPKISA